jgi:hypothetical protein
VCVRFLSKIVLIHHSQQSHDECSTSRQLLRVALYRGALQFPVHQHQPHRQPQHCTLAVSTHPRQQELHKGAVPLLLSSLQKLSRSRSPVTTTTIFRVSNMTGLWSRKSSTSVAAAAIELSTLDSAVLQRPNLSERHLDTFSSLSEPRQSLAWLYMELGFRLSIASANFNSLQEVEQGRPALPAQRNYPPLEGQRASQCCVPDQEASWLSKTLWSIVVSSNQNNKSPRFRALI